MNTAWERELHERLLKENTQLYYETEQHGECKIKVIIKAHDLLEALEKRMQARLPAGTVYDEGYLACLYDLSEDVKKYIKESVAKGLFVR